MSSQVSIIANGVDITNSVMYASASFESQQNALPGMFELTIKDPARTYVPPPTGSELTMSLDGVRHFGGFITQISRRFALPVDDIPSDARVWVLRGVDYNILFDKRVTRRPSNYLRHLPTFNGTQYDGDLIKEFCDSYLDLPADLDTTMFVDNIVRPFYSESTAPDETRQGAWKQQGTVWREQMDLMAEWSGGIFYVDADKRLHYHAIEDAHAPFGFSDTPDGVGTIGMRNIVATERGGPQMTNDALVWGGSEWSEDVIFGRAENAPSIAAHNRWQEAEHHFGEDGYKLTTQWRADQIVHGSPAVVGFNPGKAFPQWDLAFSWFAHRQPPGQQIRAGQLVTTHLSSFGGALASIVLPMRSVRITFPALDDSGKGHVELAGSMGLSLSDPFSIWGHLRYLRRRSSPMLSVVTNQTSASTYGGFGQFEPIHVSGNTYRLPNNIGYIAGTTQTYKDGLLLRMGVDYFETDPVAGKITFASSPGGSVLWVVCRTT